MTTTKQLDDATRRAFIDARCAIAQDAPQEPQVDEGAAIIVTGTRADFEIAVNPAKSSSRTWLPTDRVVVIAED